MSSNQENNQAERPTSRPASATALSGGQKIGLVLLFLAAWFLRIQFARDYEQNHPLAQRPVIDEASYERWALRLASGEPGSEQAFFQEPLYPYALSVVYGAVEGRKTAIEGDVAPDVLLRSQRTGARHLQAFLGALTVLLTFFFTRCVFGRAAAFVAATGMAVYQPLLLFPAYLLKPNLFLPLFTGLLVVVAGLKVERVPQLRSLIGWLSAGVLAGLCALLRGNALVLLPVLLLLPFLRVRKTREWGAAAASAVCLLAGMVSCLLPVAIRNYTVSGVFAITTVGAGTNLYGGNSPENPHGVATELPFIRGIPEYEFEDWKREAQRRLGRELGAGEVSDFWLRETFSSIADQPLVHLRILFNKLRLALGAYEVPDNHHLAWDAGFWPLAQFPFPGYTLWGWLGLAGMILFLAQHFRDRAPMGSELRGREALAIYVLYLGTIVLTVMSMRARLALVPLLLCFAGFFLSRLSPSRIRENWFPAAIALLLSALPVFNSIIDDEERQRDFDEREMNYVVYQLQSEGVTDEVLELASGLAERHPRSSRIRILAAEVNYIRAREIWNDENASEESRQLAQESAQAIMQLLREITEDDNVPPRETFRARKLAGLIHLQEESPGPAVSHLRRALEFDPSDAVCRMSLANALFLRSLEIAPSAQTEAWLTESEGLLVDLLPLRSEDAPEISALLQQVYAELVR